MKKFLSTILLVSISICMPAFADSDQANQEYTSLDNVLPSGMTVAETLQEWDNSAARYHSEPPEMEIPLQDTVEKQ